MNREGVLCGLDRICGNFSDCRSCGLELKALGEPADEGVKLPQSNAKAGFMPSKGS
jgi:hypothetical protein